MDCATLLASEPQVTLGDNDHFKEMAQNANVPHLEVVRLPLQFDNLEQEINFLALKHLLRFGARFDTALRACNGRVRESCLAVDRLADPALLWAQTSYEVTLFGLFGLFISQNSLTAAALGQLGLDEVATAFQLPLVSDDETAESPLPGVRILPPSPVRPFAEEILRVLHEVAELLQATGAPSLGAFVLKVARPSESPKARELVDALVNRFPAFQDDDCGIQFRAKASGLAAELNARYHEEDAERFGFQDMNELAPAVDAEYLAAMLRMGLVHVNDGNTGDHLPALRAACLVATKRFCDAVQEAGHRRILPCEAQQHLLAQAKDAAPVQVRAGGTAL
eukprot:m.231573 g.231573  ORF g.231573 m.231573 type:complete len:337 (-) comp10873_c0_seq6:439-1449(-)